ncbi:CHAD domain-containing protein [Streptomyces inusitatus]|uniref:CHAD domain-containing protein n=1 Tax=Streptomyces inusitatus TaxID=68221 RepID=A0A918QNA6_9ACTN|nr:CHAD domain-containing protein [Streptomyces inusitatus]GGZ58380.1 CHAD domain-containing protein [Streptomyces inusitatus]
MLKPELPRVPAQGGAPPAAHAPGGSPSAGEALAGYLHARAGEFLRGLRLHGESGADTAGAAEAARALRTASRRISGTLHTFRPMLDPVWADGLRAELTWLATTLAQEHACVSRLNRLVAALTRLSGAAGASGGAGSAAGGGGKAEARGPLGMGAARAGALLERQLTLGRTRSHSAALQALGSARFHAVADAVALLASERPPAPAFPPPPADAVTEAVRRRLLDAAAGLPLARAGRPYNADALVHGLTASAEEAQDAPWHRVRSLLRLHRYALEVTGPEPDPVLAGAGRLLDRHRDASEAATTAAVAARTPRIAPATAYVLGVLHADQRHEVEAARFAFQEIWQTAAGAPTGGGR